MQAIRTRYVGYTNTHGGRITATCEAGRIMHAYDHAFTADENHRIACDMLRRKLNWTAAQGYPPMVGGEFKGDTYWVFVYKHQGDSNTSIV
jgi:hypothetical protein